jgi:hypothetical protein
VAVVISEARRAAAEALINLFRFLQDKLKGLADWFRIAAQDSALIAARMEYRETLG